MDQRGIVIRSGVNVFGRYVRAIESKAVRNCILTPQDGVTPALISTCKTKPMFSKYYVVHLEISKLDLVDKRYIEMIKQLISFKWVILIFKISSREAFDRLRYIAPFDTFTFLDCYAVTAKVMHAYIRAELIRCGADKRYVTKTLVEHIRKRAKYKEYVLDSVIPRLAYSDLSKATVNSMIAPYRGVTVSNFGSKLFDPDKAAPVLEMLQRYSKYPDSLHKSTCDYIQTWLALYDEYVTGEFSEDSVANWLTTNGKKYGVLYGYQAKQWLRAMSTYSYEFMMLASITLRATSSSAKTFALYKLFRMVNDGFIN